MSYGLLIKGQAGYTQIDQNYSNYVVWQTGYCNMSDIGLSTNNGTYLCAGQVVYSLPIKPLIFIRYASTNTFIALGALTESQVSFVAWATQANFSFEYAICIPAVHASASVQAFGLRVFNTSGIVFDSGLRYPRVLETFSYTPYVDGYGGGYFTPTITSFTTSVSNPWISINCRSLSPASFFYENDYSVSTCGVSCTGSNVVKVSNAVLHSTSIQSSAPYSSAGPYSMCVASSL
jgi:hypothetical protein